MGYLHIENLYKIQDILLFRECYALEKIHGTSAHIGWDGNQLRFFTGDSHANFIKLFDAPALMTKLAENGLGIGRKCVIYGEHYGGSIQGMSDTYGKDQKFIVFDVQIDDLWLNVEKAHGFAQGMGLEFVHYCKIPTTIEAIDAERDAPSVQAIRNGISTIVNLLGPVENPKKREGVVLRPLIELRKNNDDRIIAKHRNDEFRETKSPRVIDDPAKLKVLTEADEIAEEYVTAMRLRHVLDKLPGHCIERMPEIIKAMIEDVEREAAGEIVSNNFVRKAIGKKTALTYKDYLKCAMHQKASELGAV
jgi:hypothetical protein